MANLLQVAAKGEQKSEKSCLYFFFVYIEWLPEGGPFGTESEEEISITVGLIKIITCNQKFGEIKENLTIIIITLIAPLGTKNVDNVVYYGFCGSQNVAQ